MVGKMRKSITPNTSSNHKKSSKSKSGKKNNKHEQTKRRGPRLPNALLREVGGGSKNSKYDEDDMSADSDGEINNDFYEYEETFAEEETSKNKRFDPVENYQYELPDDFKDENIDSDDDDLDNDEDDEEEEDGRHLRMLQTVTGLSSETFESKKKREFNVPGDHTTESEYDMSGDVDVDDGPVTLHDFLEPIQKKPGYSVIRKNLRRMESKANPILVPIPKAEQERINRNVAYDHAKKDITKWEALVKRGREATTVFFDEDVDLGYSTIGAIAADFEPRTDFEKNMASHWSNDEIVEAHNKDGARLLELNKLSIEEMKNRRDEQAKMRSLLFHHELKAKRIKKIKSKTYHRILQKDKRKAAASAYELDPEAAKEASRKQEYDRAKERMRLKHKNSSKWAKRILQRGLDVADPDTRVALAEQLAKNAALTRKMSSVNESSSSDESSDHDSDDLSADSDDDSKSKLLLRAKEKTIGVLEADEELPTGGVLNLPFMVRGLKKRREIAEQEANAAVEEYDLSLKQLQGDNVKDYKGASSGRMAFGAPKTEVRESSKKVAKSDNYFGNSDSESDDERKENDSLEFNANNKSHRMTEIDPSLLHEISGVNHDSVFKTVEDVEDPETKTNIEVAYLASNSWKKMKKSSGAVKENENGNIHDSQVTVRPPKSDQDIEGDDEDDSDSGGEMVDGILSAGPKSSYEIPSHEEVIQRAFAGDDVEEAFEKDKEAVLDEENPEPEKPKLVLGWGQWTDVQKKKGLPSWQLREHEEAKKKREESLQKRKDSHLSKVIISEKFDHKKAEKLHVKTLPFPYTSQEVYHQSIRMPIGPEFNPATAVGALTRPEVVKKSGIIIKPIQYEDMNTDERAKADRQNGGQKRKNGKDKKQSTKKKKTAKV